MPASRTSKTSASKATKETVAAKAAPKSKTATTTTASTKKPAGAKKTAAKKTAAKKSAPKKSAAKKSAAKQAPAATATAKKTAAKKTAAKKSAATKAAPAATAAKQSPDPSGSSVKATSTLATSKAAASKAAPKPELPDYLTDTEWLEAQKAELIAERARYTKSAKSLADEAAMLMADREPGDVQFDEESGEGDTIAVERDRDLALSAKARESVDEIDAAFERLKKGTYGICTKGGDFIPKERLEAIPEASICVQHKTAMF